MYNYDPATIKVWQDALDKVVNSQDPLLGNGLMNNTRTAVVIGQKAANMAFGSNPYASTYNYPTISNVEAEAIQDKLDNLREWIKEYAERNNNELIKRGLEPVILPERLAS